MLASTAIEEIRARLQELVADFWTSLEVYRALNEGQRRFSAQEKWPWLYTVGSGSLIAATPTLALPAGVSAERVFGVLVTFTGDSRPRQPRRVTAAEGQRQRLRNYLDQSEPDVYYTYSQEVADSNELQSIANAGSTAGTFTIIFDGQTTGAISRGATAAVIQTELQALSNVGAADVHVYGGPLGTATVFVNFIGALAGTDVPAMTLGATSTSMTVATPNAGGGLSGEYTTTLRFVPGLSRDASVEYLYIRDPRTLSVGTDVLDVPEEYAMGVVAWATGSLFLKELQDSRKADEQFALFRSVVDDASREYKRVSTDQGFSWGGGEPNHFTGDPDYVLSYRSIPAGGLG